MKIYNKKGFISGIIMFIIGILGLKVSFFNNFELKLFICSALSFLIGATGIGRSLSLKSTKEDILEEKDERNIYISLKSKSKVWQIMSNLNLVIFILLFTGFIITRQEVYISLFIIPGIYITLGMIIEIIVFFYYEKHE